MTCAWCAAGCGESPETPAEPASPITRASASRGTMPVDDLHRQLMEIDVPAVVELDGKLSLDRLVFTVPEGWKQKEASSGFVLAEFRLPNADGDGVDGRLTVSVASGTIQANIDRWRDQFGGKPAKASEEHKEIGLNIAIVDFSGEFNDQRGPYAVMTERSGYRMLAAIIPVEGELHFVKAVGPEATIAAHAESFHEFISSVSQR